MTLPLDVVQRIARFINPRDLREIYFTGGEPLLPDNCVEVATFLNEWSPRVAVTGATNGLRPDLYLPRVEAMIRNGVFINLMVSLNGLPEWHDYTRGTPGNYEAALRMATGLRNLGALVALNLLSIPPTATERGTTKADVEHVRRIAADYGVPLWGSPIRRNMPWFGVEDDGATIPMFACHGGGEVLAIHENGDIMACQEPRPSLKFANLRDERIEDGVIERIQAEIEAKSCQPCGCCTAAFTHGRRCVT